MNGLPNQNEKPIDYRALLYERYVTEQMRTEITGLRRTVESGMPYYAKLVEDHFPRNCDAKILDVGCGYGPLLFALSQKGYSNLSGIHMLGGMLDAVAFASIASV